MRVQLRKISISRVDNDDAERERGRTREQRNQSETRGDRKTRELGKYKLYNAVIFNMGTRARASSKENTQSRR